MPQSRARLRLPSLPCAAHCNEDAFVEGTEGVEIGRVVPLERAVSFVGACQGLHCKASSTNDR